MDEKDEAGGQSALDERLALIEDNAWVGMSTAKAMEFVLGNLLLELHRSKVLDGPAFISNLRQVLEQPGLMPAPQRLGVESILQSLQACLPTDQNSPGGPYH